MEDANKTGPISAAQVNERLLDYGARIIKLVGALPKGRVGSRIGDQLLRSAIAVGAH